MMEGNLHDALKCRYIRKSTPRGVQTAAIKISFLTNVFRMGSSCGNIKRSYLFSTTSPQPSPKERGLSKGEGELLTPTLSIPIAIGREGKLYVFVKLSMFITIQSMARNA